MMYLVFGCDPVGDRVLWEEDEVHGNTMSVSLPPDLVTDMLAWNEQMAGAVLATAEATSALARLNSDGANLAKRIAAAVPGGAKVRFLSE
ncbi:hypothetical protein SAMN05192583_3472 [Sphingomonas gellani]|uniref:Uncharacterized protein n=1 Tax=Sphingomonas gellani TaxID=1166340 RepID=A0A1H8J3F5_9SPHN|nr:hypothetical protein SAMN05192583_3472 [Sphingomonas gellani]